ncbi:MAG: LCCL domain-containing protein [bacterium]
MKIICGSISLNDGTCFGDNIYSDRSNICLAAMNSGMITE